MRRVPLALVLFALVAAAVGVAQPPVPVPPAADPVSPRPLPTPTGQPPTGPAPAPVVVSSLIDCSQAVAGTGGCP